MQVQLFEWGQQVPEILSMFFSMPYARAVFSSRPDSRNVSTYLTLISGGSWGCAGQVNENEHGVCIES